ncbi:MAG: hypothetical protein JO164_12525 [Candidatus Eremiobacteraeota bacterium]|nr:hypothetical protein [Candidatus Eremiobacteraeota bacterium]
MESPRIRVAAGIIIAAGALLTLVAVAHHPTVGHHTRGAAALAAVVRFAPTDRLVHGTLIAVIGALVYAFAVYTLRRGTVRPAALAGFVAYTLGSATTIVAASIDGFLVPEIAARYAGAPPETLPAATSLLILCSLAIQVATKLGMAALGAGIVLWSTDLIRESGVVRAVGALGFVAAVASVIAAFAGTGALTPASLLLVLAAQTVWYLAVAALLVRGRV